MNFLLFCLLCGYISAYNLIVQVNHRYLNSCFEDIREWIVAYMRSNLIGGKFHQTLRTGSIQATDLQTTNLNLRFASLERHRGEHYLQIKGFNIKLKGNWYYKLLYIITDSGTFSLSVDDMNITIGNIEPEVFSGLPFINTDLNCKTVYGSFAFSLDHPKTLSNILSGFMHRLMRSKFESTICMEVTSAFDAFLRHGVEQLFFRHTLPSGAILNNSLVSKPLLSAEGDLTTYHYGIVKESTIPTAELIPLERRPYDVTYSIKSQLLEEILSTIHQKSLFDGSYKDDLQYSLTVKCTRRPEVRLEGEGIIMILDEHFVVTSNNVVLLNDTFTIGLLLKALYSHRLQLRFQVLRSSSMDFLTDDLPKEFATKLQRQWSTAIGTYLRVPLPSAFGILARNASLTIDKSFIVFAVNIDPQKHHNTIRRLMNVLWSAVKCLLPYAVFSDDVFVIMRINTVLVPHCFTAIFFFLLFYLIIFYAIFSIAVVIAYVLHQNMGAKQLILMRKLNS